MFLLNGEIKDAKQLSLVQEAELGTPACRRGCLVLQCGEGCGSGTFKTEFSASSALGKCRMKLQKMLIPFNGPSLRFGVSLPCLLSQVTTVTQGDSE